LNRPRHGDAPPLPALSTDSARINYKGVAPLICGSAAVKSSGQRSCSSAARSLLLRACVFYATKRPKDNAMPGVPTKHAVFPASAVHVDKNQS